MNTYDKEKTIINDENYRIFFEKIDIMNTLVDDIEVNIELSNALKSLSAIEQAVIFLLFQENLSQDEAGKILEICSKSVSRIKLRAINKLKKAGYKVGILIAPVILVDNWEKLYKELIEYLEEHLSDEVKLDVFFEIIFMTYSYVHNAINQEAFPDKNHFYNKDFMTGRGKGK